MHFSPPYAVLGHVLGDEVAGNVDQLMHQLDYIDAAESRHIQRALAFADRAHRHQRRKTGEPFVLHPIRVASMLATLRASSAVLVAAILHDTLEDTPVTFDIIVMEFNRDIALMVSDLSKILDVKFDNADDKNLENAKKLIAVMSHDIRVVMIKLCDRIDNMKSVCVHRRSKQIILAKQSLDIYVPMGKRFGFMDLSRQLEDMAFKVIYPYRHMVLTHAVRQLQLNRLAILVDIQDRIQRAVDHANLSMINMTCREKTIVSIYQKMKNKKMRFSQLTDVNAIRIIVSDVSCCYAILGIVHEIYRPRLSLFKDYIALPKPNGYQSLHTVVYGPQAVAVEIQIRTQQMDEYATSGSYAHMSYKNNVMADMRHLSRVHVAFQKLVGQARNDQAARRLNHYDTVDVLSEDRRLIQLPKGSTFLDFAYALGEDIGDRAVCAYVQNHYRQLDDFVESGMQITIITGIGSPHEYWRYIQSVRTTVAKQRLMTLMSQDALPLKLFGMLCIDKVKRFEHFNLGVSFIQQSLRPSICCFPITGDAMVAQSSGQGMDIHREDCHMLTKAKSLPQEHGLNFDTMVFQVWCKAVPGFFVSIVEVISRMPFSAKHFKFYRQKDLVKIVISCQHVKQGDFDDFKAILVQLNMIRDVNIYPQSSFLQVFE